MRRFVKTTVPADGYEEVRKVGERYVVHMEPVNNGDGSMTCYECMTDSEPDMGVLGADLQAWKAYIAEMELATAKKVKTDELLAYDSSDAVNSFELRQGGVKMTEYWIDRDLRTSLEGDVRAAEKEGTTYVFDIRELGQSLVLNCAKFLDALEVLRQYAYKAYNQTSRHMAAINALTTVEEVEAYDYTVDYPEKLFFNVEDLV